MKIEMKRYVFIIGLWAAGVALPNALQAQWSFTATVTKTGSGLNCALDYSLLNGLARNYVPPRTYDSKAKCETAKQYLTSQATNCVSIACGPCTGGEGFSDGFGDNSGAFGNTNITATNQGDPFHSDNPFEALPDAYEQKNLQNEILLGKRDIGSAKYGGYVEKGVAVTGDGNFDAQFAKFTTGRPLGFFIGSVPSDEELINQRKRGRSGEMGGFNSPRRYSNQRGVLGKGQMGAVNARGSEGRDLGGEMKDADNGHVRGKVYGGGMGAAGDADLSAVDRKKLENDIATQNKIMSKWTTEINTKIKKNPDKVKKLIDKLSKSENPKDKAMAESLQTQYNNAINSPKINETNNKNNNSQEMNNKDCGLKCQSKENQAKIKELDNMSTALDNIE
jgi:hypothetical protein